MGHSWIAKITDYIRFVESYGFDGITTWDIEIGPPSEAHLSIHFADEKEARARWEEFEQAAKKGA